MLNSVFSEASDRYAKSTVRTIPIVMLTPLFDQHLNLE
jgi:hypothetical protein